METTHNSVKVKLGIKVMKLNQAKSGDMQFMHVIIAVTDTTHATILYKKRGVNWIPLLT